MRVKLVTSAVALLVTFAFAFELSTLTASTQNTNTSTTRRTPRRPAKEKMQPPAQTETQPQTEAQPQTDPAMEKKPTRRRAGGKRGMKMMSGVPSGVHNCLDHLMEMANMETMPAYEGRPEEIINNGLMWNDPKSKCSIGGDAALRLKVLNMANAWRMKDQEKVKSLLNEIKSQAPQG